MSEEKNNTQTQAEELAAPKVQAAASKETAAVEGQAAEVKQGEQPAGAEATEQSVPQDPEASAEADKANRKLRRGRAKMRSVHWFALHAIVFITVIYVLFAHFVGLTTMPTADMYPRLDAGDLLLYWRLDNTHKAQDVVYFEKDGSAYVGRVIAVGGDTVEITDAETVKVNGNTLMESNIFASTPRYEGFVKYPLTLEPDTYFILADSREGGRDSRYFGPVSADEIKGVVVTVMRRHNL